jgi:hypothetical protein
MRVPSGRPQPGEYPAYAQADIDYVAGDDAVAALTDLATDTLRLLGGISDETARGLTYAPGKWTLKEVIGHLTDDERIFAYRALCAARGDDTPLPGFEETLYVANGNFEERSMSDLLAEYRIVRDATLALLRSLPDEAWQRRGTANEHPVSVRGIAFHIAGHELHHLRVVREKYLAAS